MFTHPDEGNDDTALQAALLASVSDNLSDEEMMRLAIEASMAG